MSNVQRRILVIEGVQSVRNVIRALLARAERPVAQTAQVLDTLYAAAPEKLLINLRCAETDVGTAPQIIKSGSMGFVGTVLVLTADINGPQAFQEVCELIRQQPRELPTSETGTTDRIEFRLPVDGESNC